MAFSERKLRLFGPLVLFAVGTAFFRLDWYFELSWRSLLRTDLIALGSGYICWEVARGVAKWFQKRYSGLLNTRTRIKWLLLTLPVLVNLAWLLRVSIRVYLGIDSWESITLPNYTYTVGIQIFYHCVYFVVYEGLYSMQQWKETHSRKEALRKAALQNQLESLKHQVNPHFLFNSLNALTTLISENPARAEAFVDEISSVYRYLLRTNPNELTTLREELAFLNSYFHLYKTRYCEGIQLHSEIPEAYQDYQLIPLTLQTLLENAVRHNIISPEQPLHISLQVINNQLVVWNNLQRKRMTIKSDEGDLATLAAQYKRMEQRAITIQETDDTFIVSLPLFPQDHLIAS